MKMEGCHADIRSRKYTGCPPLCTLTMDASSSHCTAMIVLHILPIVLVSVTSWGGLRGGGRGC